MHELTIGIQKLDAWMKATGTTQEVLAEKIGVSQQSISAYLKKGRAVPLQQALAISRLTDIRVEDFASPADSSTSVEPIAKAG